MKSAEFLKLEHLLKASFGINQYKTEVLSFLLVNGECRMGEIKGDVPRPRKYDILETLEKEGFVKIIKKKKKNGLGKLHKDYVKAKRTRYISFDLQKIIDNRKKQEQLKLNEKLKVMDGFKSQMEKQIKTLIRTANYDKAKENEE